MTNQKTNKKRGVFKGLNYTVYAFGAIAVQRDGVCNTGKLSLLYAGSFIVHHECN